MIEKIEKLRDLNVRTLQWLQPNGWIDSYELHDGDKIIATLKIPRWWNDRGTVEADKEKWIMQRKGVFSMDVSIHDGYANSHLGVIRKFIFRDDELEIFGQGKYRIRWIGILMQKWGIFDHINRKVAVFSRNERGIRELFKHQAAVDIMPDFQELPTITLMVCASWYFYILESKAAAIAAAS
jgi:hypothetical protein